MARVHLIPTDKPSRLCLDSKDVLHFAPKSGYYTADGKQNIYITNSEEIKEGDWCYQVELNDGKIDKCYDVTLYHTWTNNGVDKKIKYKKIILTTDQDLIKDGVQAIDDEFLEWFVKNPSCESVETDSYKTIYHTWLYKITIPIVKAESDFLKSEFEEISSNFPTNLPLYKDSGSWQLRTEDMEDVIEQQGVNESFYDFLERISDAQLRKDFEQEVVK